MPDRKPSRYLKAQERAGKLVKIEGFYGLQTEINDWVHAGSETVVELYEQLSVIATTRQSLAYRFTGKRLAFREAFNKEELLKYRRIKGRIRY